jgi:intergrase/recombinase
VALLKKHVNKDDKLENRYGEPLALVSMDGKPLVHKSYNKKGHLTKTDAVRNAYNRTAEKLKNHGITINGSFKHFRKTAASKLEEHDTYGRYVVHFLGQSPRTVAGRHYVTPSQEQFTAAVEWLRTQFLPIANK